MDLNTKMLQAIIDGQSAMREHFSHQLNMVNLELKSVRDDIRELDSRLTSRIDQIGLQLARLEDDTPIKEEFDSLQAMVAKHEQQLVSLI